MSTLENSGIRTKHVIAIALGSVIAALAGFVGSAGAEPPAGDPDFAAGYAVGTGLAYGVVIWLAAHFLALRKGSKSIKRTGALAIIGCALLGAIVGATI